MIPCKECILLAVCKHKTDIYCELLYNWILYHENTRSCMGEVIDYFNCYYFHLSSGGVTMDESSPLSEYNVSDGDDVLLIPASTAG